MSLDYEIVVSAENSPYIAWQTQLFCFSALTRLGRRPTVVVHRSAAHLLAEFETIKNWGCPVIEAPQFRIHSKGDYPPRNEPGSLLTLAGLPEFKPDHVLFCEPDMLFVKPPNYTAELSGEHYTYLDYTQKRICDVAHKFGMVHCLRELNQTSAIGVPYIIPTSVLPKIARRWMEVLDCFEELKWIDIMYAFGLSLVVEGLAAKTTHFMTDNYDPLKRLDHNIIHYCYGDWRWNKRAFQDGRSPLASAPTPSRKGLTGSVLGEILSQIGQARGYSQLPAMLRRAWRFAAANSM